MRRTGVQWSRADLTPSKALPSSRASMVVPRLLNVEPNMSIQWSPDCSSLTVVSDLVVPLAAGGGLGFACFCSGCLAAAFTFAGFTVFEGRLCFVLAFVDGPGSTRRTKYALHAACQVSTKHHQTPS
eukprot:SAG25_NODE_1002_length_4348_cov_7.069663_5_plen_127_part_00